MEIELENILTEQEMGLARSPDELSTWVERKAKELSSSIETKKFSRSGKRLPKKFWEEIRPVSLFVNSVYNGRRNVTCKPNLGNEDFDGTIVFNGSQEQNIYVEITYAKDGYDESLRLEVLNEEGSVNALGNIDVSGRRASGNRSIEVRNEAVKHNEVREKAIQIVKKCISDKCDGRYGQDHILIVVFDDYLPFRTEEDREMLLERVQHCILSLNPKFKKIILLGASGRNLINV